MTEYARPDRGLSPNDRSTMTRKGWFPPTTFMALEELRQRHEELIDQRAARQAEVAALEQAFIDEDEAYQRALDASYRDATADELPEVTPPEDRKAELDEAAAHALAAGRAVVSFAYEALDRLRGADHLPDGWNPWQAEQMHRVPPGGIAERLLSEIASEEGELRQKIAEAERLIEASGQRLRAFAPLKTWLFRNGNAGHNQMMSGADLPIPATHSPMSKPRDLHVPGWWPADPDGTESDTGTVAEGQEHLIPDDAEEGVVEMSDPWHLEQERRVRQEA